MVEPQPSKLMARVRLPLPAPKLRRWIQVVCWSGTELTTLYWRELKAIYKAQLTDAHIAQVVEHFLGKEEVIGSNPIVSTRLGAIVL